MSLSTLQRRVNWLGGNQLQRINKQKLRSLLWALKNDYNSRTIKVLNTDATFQALINLDNLKPDYDRKIISVPFDSKLEPGDVFQCLDDKTKWMVYLPHLTETAYLHADIIRCRYQLTVNDNIYDIYFQGMTETDVPWRLKRSVNFNELNWSGTVYIKNNDETRNYFNRFTKIQIDGKPYEVEVVDCISVPGIIELELLEDFSNTVKDLPKITITQETEEGIIGKDHIYLGEKASYTIPSDLTIENGQWEIITENDENISILVSNKDYCVLQVKEKNIDSFILKYDNYTKTIFVDETPAAIIEGKTEVYPYDIVTYSLIDPSSIGDFSIDDKTKAHIVKTTKNSCTIEILTSKKTVFNLIVTVDNKVHNIPITVLSF